jgi:hypothetical protein
MSPAPTRTGSDGPAVGVGDDVGPVVGVGVGVGVAVGVGVGVGAVVGVAVGAGVGVGAIVGGGGAVAVGAAVGVAVGAGVPVVSTSCGGFVPSRLENVALSVLVEVMASEYVPLAANDDAGSVTSTQRFAVTAPTVPASAPSAGLLFHVTVVSDQFAVTGKTFPPTTLASVVYRRRVAAVAGLVSPATVKRTYERYSGVGARTWSLFAFP